MKDRNFCTISTTDYFPYCRTLYDSLVRYHAGCVLHVFITDGQPACVDRRDLPESIRLYGIDELCSSGTGQKVFETYHASSMDKFRWCMKPVFLEYLVDQINRQQVMYVDNDMYFFNEYNFLFDDLDRSSVLLTPHWRTCDPKADQKNFFSLYTSGLYNAGFVGVNKDALPALRWWAMACLYICEKDPSRGQWDDQSHLNLLPIYFDNVRIIKHRGCNVANWNRIECAREQTGDSVLINGKDPIVFIHFTRSTIRGILRGDDPLLAPFLTIYRQHLKRYGVNLPDAATDKPSARPAGAGSRILQCIRALFNG
jgi:hypothetical protein